MLARDPAATSVAPAGSVERPERVDVEAEQGDVRPFAVPGQIRPQARAQHAPVREPGKGVDLGLEAREVEIGVALDPPHDGGRVVLAGSADVGHPPHPAAVVHHPVVDASQIIGPARLHPFTIIRVDDVQQGESAPDEVSSPYSADRLDLASYEGDAVHRVPAGAVARRSVGGGWVHRRVCGLDETQVSCGVQRGHASPIGRTRAVVRFTPRPRTFPRPRPPASHPRAGSRPRP